MSLRAPFFFYRVGVGYAEDMMRRICLPGRGFVAVFEAVSDKVLPPSVAKVAQAAAFISMITPSLSQTVMAAGNSCIHSCTGQNSLSRLAATMLR